MRWELMPDDELVSGWETRKVYRIGGLYLRFE
jgi:hypothetical protein